MPAGDVDLATDIRSSILAQSPRGGRAILWVTLALFVLFIVWAALSEIEQVTRGAGKVIPSSQIQVVQNLEGGIISEILVDVGDMVEKGDVIGLVGETGLKIGPALYFEIRKGEENLEPLEWIKVN